MGALLFILLTLLIGCGSDDVRLSTTLSWTRNQEDDMQDYLIYACRTPGCTPDVLLGVVLQTPFSVDPQFSIDDLIGSWLLAVRARDTSLNLSPLSDVLAYHRG